MDIKTLISARRTINFFKAEKVDSALVRNAIDAARWAPNHHLTEPWHFHILTGQTRARVIDLITEIKSAGQGEAVRSGVMKRLHAIPGWLVITSDLSPDPVVQMENYAACCCAAQNMMLYLWDEGVGMKWTSGAVTRDERFFELLGADPGAVMIVGLFWYGYPEQIPEQTRKPVTDIITLLD